MLRTRKLVSTQSIMTKFSGTHFLPLFHASTFSGLTAVWMQAGRSLPLVLQRSSSLRRSHRRKSAIRSFRTNPIHTQSFGNQSIKYRATHTGAKIHEFCLLLFLVLHFRTEACSRLLGMRGGRSWLRAETRQQETGVH